MLKLRNKPKTSAHCVACKGNCNEQGEFKYCPRCGEHMPPYLGALSRRDNKTYVCSRCGETEAVHDAATGMYRGEKILASASPAVQQVAQPAVIEMNEKEIRIVGNVRELLAQAGITADDAEILEAMHEVKQANNDLR